MLDTSMRITPTKILLDRPKVLYSDLASEITSSMFERYLLVKGVNHVTTW